jgi:hypothetical protein
MPPTDVRWTWIEADASCYTAGKNKYSFLSSLLFVLFSDGWDRTAQLACLAQLLVDEKARTFRGLLLLIEREWCALGHKFSTRSGVGSGTASTGEQGPIFLQFLDGLYQLMMQHPHAFEFAPSFLVTVMDAVLSGRFVTFLGDCSRERIEFGFGPCFYAWALRTKPSHLNHTYVAVSGLLPLSTDIRQLRLWEDWFLRYK